MRSFCGFKLMSYWAHKHLIFSDHLWDNHGIIIRSLYWLVAYHLCMDIIVWFILINQLYYINYCALNIWVYEYRVRIFKIYYIYFPMWIQAICSWTAQITKHAWGVVEFNCPLLYDQATASWHKRHNCGKTTQLISMKFAHIMYFNISFNTDILLLQIIVYFFNYLPF